MQREYKRTRKNYKKIKKQWLTHQEMAKKLGYKKSRKKLFLFIQQKAKKNTIVNTVQEKSSTPKDYRYTNTYKVSELKYIIARKDAKIRFLEMKNELCGIFSRSQKVSEDKYII